MRVQVGRQALTAIGFSLVLVLSACTGDASKMAADQPRSHDMTVLKKGTQRHRVIAEFGKPVLSEVQRQVKVDIFRFVDGYSKAARTSRSCLHGAASVVTFGAWDIIGKPVESGFSGEEVRLRVTYDGDDRVNIVEKFK